MQNSHKSRSRKCIAQAGRRCIYCRELADTVEHMPPSTMFKKKYRPSGLEFPSCKRCNNSTSAADAMASVLSRISVSTTPDRQWMLSELRKPFSFVLRKYPEVGKELLSPSSSQQIYMRTPAGLDVPKVGMSEGHITRALLDVFGAKLAMALHFQHTGEPVPDDGWVYSKSYPNSATLTDDLHYMMSIFPHHSMLSQGKSNNSKGQFEYIFYTDEKSIVASMIHFHHNLHYITLSVSGEHSDIIAQQPSNFKVVKVGEVHTLMP